MNYAPPPDEGAARSVMHRLKELYLSVFVLFYRFAAGLWPPEMNADAHKGVAGVSLVEGLLALSLGAWLEIVTRHRVELNPLIVGAAFFALFFVNYYFLVARSTGVAFEKRFSSFPISKRVLLRVLAIGVVLIAVIAFCFSMSVYQRAFGGSTGT